MIHLDDERLELVLASIGEHLAVAPRATRSAVPRAGRRRALAVLAAAVTAVSLLLSPVRGAVADWLGVGSTRVDIVPAPPSTLAPLPAIDAGLAPLDAAQAAQRLGAPLPRLDGTELGAPAGFASMPEGGVLVVWPDGSTLWLHERPGGGDAGDGDGAGDVLLDKRVADADLVQRVEGLGDAALAVSGAHQLHTPHRRIAATTTVLWTSGAWELRLEADRPVEELVAIARDLDRP